jgi:hypothetical protein
MTRQLRMNCNRVQRALEARNHPEPNESPQPVDRQPPSVRPELFLNPNTATERRTAIVRGDDGKPSLPGINRFHQAVARVESQHHTQNHTDGGNSKC